jgi:two-component system sensor histidine kinase BaeS
VADGIVGAVIVPPRAPFRFLLGRYLPTLGLVAFGSLVVGTAFTAFLVFGPARRRLRLLEEAARRLGTGDLSARAPAQGGDEVAAVAAAFNAMAGDLAARAEALAASDRLRRQLLADVSHELATPVTAMRGYLETLAMPDFPLDEATRAKYLTIVTDETTRLERIIGDLLELARLEGGGTAFAVTTMPTAALFERIVARHGRTSEAAGISFTARIAPGAEAVRGDRDRLEQALQNLAANAVRHAPPGSTIELEARPAAGGGVRLSVTDRGAGIAPAHLPHVFDRFYKADAARVNRSGAEPASHGSGLGLSIVKAIVERHGGTVHVESEPGRTTFAVELP